MIEKYFALNYYIEIIGLIIILAPFIIIGILYLILTIVEYVKRWLKWVNAVKNVMK